MARSHILKGFSDIESALWVHKYYPGLTGEQMVKTVLENGYTVTDTANYEIAQLLHEWGLTDKKSRTLTSQGEAFYSLWETKRSVAIDVLHGLQYSLWTKKTPKKNIASWAYKTICDYLWERELLLETTELIRYIGNLRNISSNTIPPDVGNAFSNKSINDAYDWLLPLEPPVMYGVEGIQIKSYKNATFKQRQFCSPALFIMGLAYVVREEGYQFGDLVKIDEEQRQKVCSCCLIEPTSFDMMLDNALRMISYISLQKQWDLYIAIDRKPEISDFL
jgi:hypothetical protein